MIVASIAFLLTLGLALGESYDTHLRQLRRLGRERRHHVVEFLSHLVDVFLR